MGAYTQLAIYAYLDLAYSVRVLSQFCNNPGFVHIELVKYVLQYISETLNLDLKFDKETDIPNDVTKYIDVNFTGSKKDEKLTRCYFFMSIGVVINQLFKPHSIISLLIYKAKYVAIYKAE